MVLQLHVECVYSGICGGILAHSMGYGTTAIMIALVLCSAMLFEMLRHNRHHDRTWSCRKPFRRISPADGNNALELDNLLKPLQLTVPFSRDEQFVQRRQLIEYVQMSLSAGAAASIR